MTAKEYVEKRAKVGQRVHVATQAVAGTVKLVVIGEAQPQGSKTAIVGKDGRARVIEGRRGPARREFHSWRSAVADAARAWCARNGMPAPLDGPLALDATFFMPRPKSAPKRVTRPCTRPDLDKLARAIFDSLSGIVYVDDARIVDLAVRKRFAIDSPPRVEIEITNSGDS